MRSFHFYGLVLAPDQRNRYLALKDADHPRLNPAETLI